MTELQTLLARDVEGAFERVVVGYQGRLYSFALGVTGNRQDAEEVAQDAFVRAYRALRSYDAKRIASLSLTPWLYRITLNVARNKLRGRRLATVSLEGDDDAGWEAIRDGREGPQEVAEATERRAALAAHVAELPLRYRAPVVLRHVEGLSYEEIAATLEQPVGTVKSHVHRAIGLLRGAIEHPREVMS